jgi:hypothetical protein
VGGTIAVIAACLVAIVGLAAGVLALTGHLGNEGAPAPSASPNAATRSPGQEGATAWSLGKKFQAGDLAVTLTSYKDQLTSLDGEGKWVAENGQWVVIGLTVEYTGTDQGSFVPEQQVIVASDGKSYPNDPKSALHYKEDALGAEPLKPDDPQSGYMAFDIPLDKVPTAVEFVGKIGEPAITIPLG